MYNEKKLLGVFIIMIITLIIIPAALVEGKADGSTEEKLENISDFELTVKDGLISLKTKDASLREIIEEIGKSMKIKVVGAIPDEERISAEFDKLSLEEALEKLSTNYGLLTDSEKEEKKITKIIILPKGKEAALSSNIVDQSETMESDSEGNESERPEPFKFEFDPSAYIK